MNKFMHWVYLVVISVLLILLWQSREAAAPVNDGVEIEEVVVTQSDDETRKMIGYLEALVAELQAENRSLTLMLTERLEAQAAARAPAEPESQEPAPPPTLDGSTETANAERALERALRNAAEGFMSGDDFALRAEHEPVDPDWAYPLEQNLQDLFITDESLRDFNIDELKCYTSFCELKVSSLGDVRFDSSALHRSLREQDWAPTNIRMMSLTTSEGRSATVYFDFSGELEERP